MGRSCLWLLGSAQLALGLLHWLSTGLGAAGPAPPALLLPGCPGVLAALLPPELVHRCHCHCRRRRRTYSPCCWWSWCGVAATGGWVSSCAEVPVAPGCRCRLPPLGVPRAVSPVSAPPAPVGSVRVPCAVSDACCSTAVCLLVTSRGGTGDNCLHRDSLVTPKLGLWGAVYR